MADFSKQWCEINDPDMPWDFDILEEAEKLQPGSYMYAICEGFGFTAIIKDENSDILLGFPDYETEEILFSTYKEVIDGSI